MCANHAVFTSISERSRPFQGPIFGVSESPSALRPPKATRAGDTNQLNRPRQPQRARHGGPGPRGAALRGRRAPLCGRLRGAGGPSARGRAGKHRAPTDGAAVAAAVAAAAGRGAAAPAARDAVRAHGGGGRRAARPGVVGRRSKPGNVPAVGRGHLAGVAGAVLLGFRGRVVDAGRAHAVPRHGRRLLPPRDPRRRLRRLRPLLPPLRRPAGPPALPAARPVPRQGPADLPKVPRPRRRPHPLPPRAPPPAGSPPLLPRHSGKHPRHRRHLCRRRGAAPGRLRRRGPPHGRAERVARPAADARAEEVGRRAGGRGGDGHERVAERRVPVGGGAAQPRRDRGVRLRRRPHRKNLCRRLPRGPPAPLGPPAADPDGSLHLGRFHQLPAPLCMDLFLHPPPVGRPGRRARPGARHARRPLHPRPLRPPHPPPLLPEPVVLHPPALDGRRQHQRFERPLGGGGARRRPRVVLLPRREPVPGCGQGGRLRGGRGGVRDVRRRGAGRRGEGEGGGGGVGGALSAAGRGGGGDTGIPICVVLWDTRGPIRGSAIETAGVPEAAVRPGRAPERCGPPSSAPLTRSRCPAPPSPLVPATPAAPRRRAIRPRPGGRRRRAAA